MDNKHQENISSFESKKSNLSDDYKFLIQKLKSIKDTISILEKFFSEKEI